ncbi:MAG: hypothetical protein E6778_06675 [Niallia nealsonii]|nr:hypothetical protein [Niallia nealsonii]
MQQGNVLTFSNLSQFKNIKDFNNNIEQWMLDLKSKFTKSELIALKRLVRFSAKVAGVCNAKIATIVSATHSNDAVGISRSTFKRMIIKAKELGLLLVHESVRKNGSKSSNVYVFNRFCGQAEPSTIEKLNQPKTNNLSKTINQKNNIRTEDVTESLEFTNDKLDASFVGEHVPVEFTNFVKYFFNNAKQIEEYWKLAIISARKNRVTKDIAETAIHSFKILVRKMKFSKVTNTYGFFYGILNKKFKVVFLKQAFNSGWEADNV